MWLVSRGLPTTGLEQHGYFDTNGDGAITLGELRQAMQRLLGEELSPRELAEVVQEADVNGDGTLDFEGDAASARTLCGSPSAAPPRSSPSFRKSVEKISSGED
ncbi:hypothetical protein QTO34_010185 [Cnephaeus nilssonii]|uniref:EF-hand domain-containing protein n=1 Tax=Cnephaeus nilssonii TaxID=3371016 RepID=A0AA40LE04_CNENI|nr:hypothetical protein QTO34_010185 [Eptesicus nilssonii]